VALLTGIKPVRPPSVEFGLLAADIDKAMTDSPAVNLLYPVNRAQINYLTIAKCNVIVKQILG
jgi:hypothetical protein